MEQKNLLTLSDDFLKYCELNNIRDVNKFAKEVFEKGFLFFKYGDKPNVLDNITKTVVVKHKEPLFTDKNIYDE